MRRTLTAAALVAGLCLAAVAAVALADGGSTRRATSTQVAEPAQAGSFTATTEDRAAPRRERTHHHRRHRGHRTAARMAAATPVPTAQGDDPAGHDAGDDHNDDGRHGRHDGDDD